MEIKCINNHPLDDEKILYPDLIEGNRYFVIGIEGDYYRMIGVLGKPYLYHKNRFEIIDPQPEPDWICKFEVGVGDMHYAPRLFKRNIFEDFFSNDLNARGQIFFYLCEMKRRRTEKIYNEQLVENLIPREK